jgi:hypothetical protein
MVFHITREESGFIVSSNPIAYKNLDEGRGLVLATFQANGAEFEEPKWAEDKFPCTERESYWNRLQFRQLGQYSGRKIGLFGSTSGIKETFCGPREIGEIILNEAAIRQGAYAGGNPSYIEGRKATPADRGHVTIAFLLPHEVAPRARLEELFENGVTHTAEIQKLLAA